MGILDAIFGGGSPLQINQNAALQPFMDRLTSGLGHEGGLLQRMGMGQYGDQPMPTDRGIGHEGGLLDRLQKLSGGSQMDGQTQGQQPQYPLSQNTGGLAQFVAQILQQNRRG